MNKNDVEVRTTLNTAIVTYHTIQLRVLMAQANSIRVDMKLRLIIASNNNIYTYFRSYKIRFVHRFKKNLH